MPPQTKLLIAAVILVIAAGLIMALMSFARYEPGASTGSSAGKVWSEEHQHWH